MYRLKLLLVRCMLAALVFTGLMAVTDHALAQDVKSFVPMNCQNLAPIVKRETMTYMPDLRQQWYFGALIEHESCISLKHSKCCSPKAELKTKRERGAGVSQITKAFNPDGSVRFDALGDLKRRYKTELKELTWDNILDKPDLQIRAMVLLSKGNFNSLFTVEREIEKIRMADSAYNGGITAVKNARMACHMAANCNSQIWFGNVERYIKKSTKAIYAGRSALDINLHHVKDVTVTRYGKYQQLYTAQDRYLGASRGLKTNP